MATRRSQRSEAYQRPESQKQPVPWHLLILNRTQVDALERLLREYPGEVPVKIHIGNHIRRMDGRLADTEKVRLEVARIFGLQPNSDTLPFQESESPSTDSHSFSEEGDPSEYSAPW